MYIVDCWSFKGVLEWSYYYWWLPDQQISLNYVEFFVQCPILTLGKVS